MPSIGALARRFGVDRDTIKSWSYKFSDYFSPLANPPKGQARSYNQADLKVLSFITYWHETYADSYDESDWDKEIYKALRQGEHLRNEYVLLNIPMFQELPEDIDDTCTHGVIIGGFGTYENKLQLARDYKKAADQLFNEFVETTGTYYGLITPYPVLFLYRHTVELYIKAILTLDRPPKKIHSLKTLTDNLDQLCQKIYGFNLPDWVKQRLYEFDKIDSKSATAFRYDNPNSGRFHSEIWIELKQFRLIMDKLCDEVFEKIIKLPQKKAG